MDMAYRKENALNAICPYFTMFPLEYPIRILKQHKHQSPIVLDPFCGRGTTLFAARSLGLQSWGIDSSPVAVAIAKAKLSRCSPEKVLSLAKRLIDETAPKHVPRTQFFRSAFRLRTLTQLCALREGLLTQRSDSDAAAILRAAAIGCLHGPMSKNISEAGYFSNQMPRTYASKPGYAVRYWRKHQLSAPKVDVLPVLKRKISRFGNLTAVSSGSFRRIILGDSQTESIYRRIPRKTDLVVTSPPYYGMRTYVQDQWLRNWFLGGPEEIDYSHGVQLEHTGQQTFVECLGKVWANIARSETDDLHMYVRFGIIPSAKADAKKLFRSSMEESRVAWKEISVRSAQTASIGKRQAGQMKASSEPALEFDFHVRRD
jgi:hypothetical protein